MITLDLLIDGRRRNNQLMVTNLGDGDAFR